MRRGSSGLGQRFRAFGSGLADTFLRDNKVIPPVLALLALLVFAWIVAGIFVGGSDDDQASDREELAQSEDAAEGQDTLAPEVENRNVESYAAYESKDPFRQIVSPVGESTTATNPPTTDDGGTPQNGGASPGPGRDGGAGPTDSDGDGLTDQREIRLGSDPLNPDTDGDTVPDGDDSGAGRRDDDTGGAGRGGGDRGAGRGGGLFDSGGDLLLP
jgi:hypothetical protein